MHARPVGRLDCTNGCGGAAREEVADELPRRIVGAAAQLERALFPPALEVDPCQRPAGIVLRRDADDSNDLGTWEIILWVKDGNTPPTQNTYGFAVYTNAGPVQVTPAPLTVMGTGSPSSSPNGTALTWTATASGGVPSTTQYALFRRKAGTSNWIPDVTAPAWQTSNVLSWTPSTADVGTWEIIVWVKDGNTSPTQNGYGFAAYYNAGPVQVN